MICPKCRQRYAPYPEEDFKFDGQDIIAMQGAEARRIEVFQSDEQEVCKTCDDEEFIKNIKKRNFSIKGTETGRIKYAFDKFGDKIGGETKIADILTLVREYGIKTQNGLSKDAEMVFKEIEIRLHNQGGFS